VASWNLVSQTLLEVLGHPLIERDCPEREAMTGERFNSLHPG
jgi:hypothetical protein